VTKFVGYMTVFNRQGAVKSLNSRSMVTQRHLVGQVMFGM